MGCGDSRMKLEDEMIKLKFERSRIQMERKKQIQLLEGIEHRKIAESIIPDYISLEPENHEIKIKTEEQTKSTGIKKIKNKKPKKKAKEKRTKNGKSSNNKNKKTQSTGEVSKK